MSRPNVLSEQPTAAPGPSPIASSPVSASEQALATASGRAHAGPWSWLAFPRVYAMGVALWAAFYLPFLGNGWFLDDYIFLSRLRHGASGWHLYEFTTGLDLSAAIRHGALPWWTSPNFHLAFFRPLSSLSLYLDYRLFGAAAWAWHLHSALWVLAFFAVCAALFRRVLPQQVAIIALAIVVCSYIPSVPGLWISNRHALIGLVPPLLGLSLHIEGRERGLRWGAAAGLFAVAIGLLASEASLGAVAYFYAYELTARDRPLRERLAALTPLTVLCGAYLTVYSLAGFGARGSGTYHDVTHDPLGFFLFAISALGEHLATLFAWMLPFGSQAAKQLRGYLSVVLFGFVIIRYVWKSGVLSQHRVAWLALGTLGSLLPQLAAPAQSRVQVATLIGLAPLLAAIMVAAWSAVEVRSGFGKPWPLRLAAWCVAAVYLLLSPFAHLAAGVDLRDSAEHAMRALRAAAAAGDRPAGGSVILLHAPTHVLGMYIGSMREHLGVTPGNGYVLSAARGPVELTRIDARTLELTALEGRMHDSELELLLRPANFAAGQSITVDPFRVDILAADRGHPTKIRYVFNEPLERSNSIFLAWRDLALRRIAPPGVGERLILQRTPDMPRP